jgi:hypothetical protein
MEGHSISNMAKNLAGVFSENSPTILTGLSVAGLISTSILAVKGTPKALRLLDEESLRLLDEGHNANISLSKWDIIRITYKCYIPAMAVGCASIFCIIQSNAINMRRNAALAGIYAITETAFKEYQSKIVETIGKNKELNVRDEISADRIKANPPGKTEVIFTGKGEVLCYDSLTGRYFKSSVEHIKQSINKLNRQLMNDMFITLNELYYEIGLSDTVLGESLGWNVDNGLIEINFSTQMSEDGEPCLVLNYEVSPKFI